MTEVVDNCIINNSVTFQVVNISGGARVICKKTLDKILFGGSQKHLEDKWDRTDNIKSSRT